MVAVQGQTIGVEGRCRLRLSKDHGCLAACWRGPKEDEKDKLKLEMADADGVKGQDSKV